MVTVKFMLEKLTKESEEKIARLIRKLEKWLAPSFITG